jgi:hypothetical protein
VIPEEVGAPAGRLVLIGAPPRSTESVPLSGLSISAKTAMAIATTAAERASPGSEDLSMGGENAEWRTSDIVRMNSAEGMGFPPDIRTLNA